MREKLDGVNQWEKSRINTAFILCLIAALETINEGVVNVDRSSVLWCTTLSAILATILHPQSVTIIYIKKATSTPPHKKDCGHFCGHNLFFIYDNAYSTCAIGTITLVSAS